MSITIILFSLLSSILYRVGGTKYGTLWRDLGVPTCVSLIILLTKGFHWTLILSFGLLFAALTTYNKWFGKLIFKRIDNEVHWEGWAITGLLYGLSLLPYAIYTGEYAQFATRTIFLSVATCLFSEFIGTAWFEEFCRGWLIIISLAIIL